MNDTHLLDEEAVLSCINAKFHNKVKFYREFYTNRRYIFAKYSENYSLSLCKSYYGCQCLFFFTKKKILSLINTETKLTHDFYIFFISVKFPRAANIHFLQSTSNYIIRENVSKKKKKTDEIAFKNQIFEFQIRVKILFLISWKFRLPFLIR